MLIPWPGPQSTLCMLTFEHPVWMEIQSSPTFKQRQRLFRQPDGRKSTLMSAEKGKWSLPQLMLVW